MKRYPKTLITFLFLSITLLASASSISEHSGFIKEGRCYWYRYQHTWGPTDLEFGIRISDKVQFDDKEWNRIDLIKRISRIHGSDYEVIRIEEDNSIIPVAYIREEDGNIYTSCKNIESQWEEKFSDEWLKILYGLIPSPVDFSGETPNYGYGSMGSEVTFNHWSTWYSGLTVTKTEEYENSGNVYKMYTVELGDSSEGDNREIIVIESIGAFGPYTAGSDIYFPEDVGTGELFYDPVRPFAPTRNYNPWLCYVTEGEDNKVIFEKAGGFRLWEYNGSDGVEAIGEDETYDIRWFNIQGMEISRPASPGIYVRKTGSKVEKIRL
ncbi:MAG: hypothetical protein K2M07_07095 [Muribaculaceae bacterium]|nr:hypothetical protein [Muribaculaceae bacterium]